MIDLLSAKCAIEAADIETFFSGMDAEGLSRGSKVALVFARANKQYDHVATISGSLLVQGFKVAVFEDSEIAADWLVNVA